MPLLDRITERKGREGEYEEKETKSSWENLVNRTTGYFKKK
jgi:hypothetical protein